MIPVEEFHASSAQPPTHFEGRWLVCTRGLPMLGGDLIQALRTCDAAQSANTLHACACIGDSAMSSFAGSVMRVRMIFGMEVRRSMFEKLPKTRISALLGRNCWKQVCRESEPDAQQQRVIVKLLFISFVTCHCAN